VRYLLPLAAVTAADADRVGRKAATLGELTRAGFPVPDGFAVTVDALAALTDPANRGSKAPDQTEVARRVADTPLPEDLREELDKALAALGGGPVAVRSSGVAEDLAGASYAGQYESVLGVRGPAALVAALRTCWGSAYSPRLAAYRQVQAAGGEVPALGVLIQAMVPAQAAGVAFCRNPVTGADETLVSAVRGVGDRLMAGEADADEWTVRGAEVIRRRRCDDAVDAGTVALIAALAARIAVHLGEPQDVEWAVAGGTVWVVQARPITDRIPALEAAPVDIEPPPGYAARHPSFPRPWTAMQRSVFLPVLSMSCRHVLAYTTGAAVTACTVGGWVYLTIPPDTGPGSALKLERIAADLDRGEPRNVVRRWRQEWKPAFAAAIARLRTEDPAEMTDARLITHVEAVVALFGELHDRYFRLSGAAIALLAELGSTCAELLGWSVDQTLRLRGGLSGDHMAAATGLSELAELAAGRPAVRDWLESDAGAIGAVDGVNGVDGEFGAAFDAYVRHFGHRTLDFDITEPTLAERPEVLVNLIRAQLDREYDFEGERAATAHRIAAALAEARATLADRPAEDRARFESAFEGSTYSAAVRDEKVFYAVSVWALLRYAALELGRRLLARGAVDAAEDAFHLDLAEALEALTHGTDQHDRVRTRRGAHAWALAHPGPVQYGQPPPVEPQPGMTPSPVAQRLLSATRWTTALRAARPAADTGDGVLRGIPACAGRYVGPVRIIRGVADFGRLRRGDVLVCPETSAQWAVLFPSIGALVTDRGSVLSHPAIIAREYGVPAVVATGRATDALHDNQVVVVDGGEGTVRPVADGAAGTGTRGR
jgi:pyruvate,water dikinase